jgi:3-deoxy-7-phosphoheptulonate synthase
MSLKDATPAAEQIRNKRIDRLVPLASPQSLLEELPLGARATEVLVRGRADVQAVLDGSDDRLLVVVGPCSIHDADASR